MDVSDPTSLYRLRDGVYAADLLIAAIAELDFFAVVQERDGLTVADVCRELGLDARATDVMVTYFVALGLLERCADGRVCLTQLAAEHLVAGSPYDLRAYFASMKERPACTQLLSVLRTGQPAAWASADVDQAWAARLDEREFAERITAAMHARGAYLGPALAAAVDDLPARRVLDVGGSSGVYASAMIGRTPELRATVFERPPVDRAARTLLAAAGLADRIEVVTGDMFANPLPGGHDLHLFSHVLHDWGEQEVLQLLGSSYDALEPGGWFIDHDTHIDADKSGPLPVAEYSVLLMHSTPGKCWSVGELEAMLHAVGFRDVECRPTAADRSALIARRPA